MVYDGDESMSAHSRFAKVESVRLSPDGAVAEVILRVQPNNQWGLNRFSLSAWSVRLEMVFNLKPEDTAHAIPGRASAAAIEWTLKPSDMRGRLPPPPEGYERSTKLDGLWPDSRYCP